MTAAETAVDPDRVVRVGREMHDHGARLTASVGDVRLGRTGVDDAAARATLVARLEGVAGRLRHDGTALELLAREQREVDGAVSGRFRRVLRDGWR